MADETLAYVLQFIKIMKLASFIWFTGALEAAVLASQDSSVSFRGFKVLRIDTDDYAADLSSTFENLSIIELSRTRRHGGSVTIDVAVPPEHIKIFDTLDFNVTTLSNDLGADIALEGSSGSYPGLCPKSQIFNTFLLIVDQELDENGVPDLSWFDSYHAYEDHIRYWADLQAAFANNSELIQVGFSFEGRPIQGIHLVCKTLSFHLYFCYIASDVDTFLLSSPRAILLPREDQTNLSPLLGEVTTDSCGSSGVVVARTQSRQSSSTGTYMLVNGLLQLCVSTWIAHPHSMGIFN
ncbi:hypothetical protein Daesc_010493 [Daldinia eschscholtzii]|uniref:Uncharacterized protein n=1 Tax=Daldinia eschscholtzii TaxID=292717 RepID=A0AAX6M8C4_9PEZI